MDDAGTGNGQEPSAGAPIERVSAPSLVDLSYERLRDLILNGTLAAGARLNEVELSGDMGVSRGTLRVAIRRLTDEGLLEDRPRQGALVRRFDGRDVIDIYNLRVGIEVVAARLVARRKADVGPLEAILAQMHEAAARDDLDGTMAAEWAYHLELCSLSGNDQLMQVYRMLQGRVRTALSYDNRGNEDLRDLPKRHEPLLAALRSGDERRAAAAMHAHIVGHVDEVLERVGASVEDLLGPLS